MIFSFQKIVYFIFALIVICINTKVNADEATDVTLDITYRENLKYDGGLPVRLIDSIVPSQTNVVVYLRVFDGTFENGKPVTPWVKVWDNGLLHYQLDKVSVINAGSNYNIYSYIEVIPVPSVPSVPWLGIDTDSSCKIESIDKDSSFYSFAEKGDKLLSINDVPVNNQDDIQQEMAKYNPGDVVSVVIRRQGLIFSTNFEKRVILMRKK